MKRADLLLAAMPNDRSFAAAQMVRRGSFDARSAMINGDGIAHGVGVGVHHTRPDQSK